MDLVGEGSSLIALVLIVAAIAIFLRYTQRASKASAQRVKHLSKPPENATLPPHNLDAPANMARWEIQMHDLARDMTGELDTKILIVTQLLRTAEERIGQLERAIAAAERTGGASARAQDSPPPTSAESQSARTNIDDKLRLEIYALADAGRTSADIARQIGSPAGEVELILSLRGNE